MSSREDSTRLAARITSPEADCTFGTTAVQSIYPNSSTASFRSFAAPLSGRAQTLLHLIGSAHHQDWIQARLYGTTIEMFGSQAPELDRCHTPK